MSEHPKEPTDCPLGPVEKRLHDAHRLWHYAEANYFDPDGFRLAVQNAIQTLRSVTFILQKNKEVIPDFDNWYEGWRERFRSEPLMRWLVEARNRIEKQGDLEPGSFIHADIVASYLDEGPGLVVAADAFDRTDDLIGRIPEGAIRDHVMKNGALRIQRRWREKSLPDYEILDALAISYGRLNELIHDAHRQIGRAPPPTLRDDTGAQFDLASMGWRMPCMVGHERPRTLFISLEDGERFRLVNEAVKVDVSDKNDWVDRYGLDPSTVMREKYEKEEDAAVAFFELARRVFLRDGYHLPFLFFFRQGAFIQMHPFQTESQNQKYLIMRHLADEVTRSGAEFVISVGEAWTAPARPLAPYRPASESEERKELLELSLVSKTGEPIQLSAEIIRDGEKVSLGQTEVLRQVIPWRFAPFYGAWKRPIPPMWYAASGSPQLDASQPARSFAPLDNHGCLCGSGKKFKNCCVDKLPGTKLGIQTRNHMKRGHYKKALTTCRADITQYTIWHKRHTVLAIRLGIDEAERFLEIDMRALAELVDDLFLCYQRTSKMLEFPSVLDRLRGNISDPRWERKIIYFRALSALYPDWDSDKGRAELSKLQTIETDNDIETLQLYLDLFGRSMNVGERTTLIERIVSLAEKDIDRLHYRMARAMLDISQGDLEGAKEKIDYAIKDFRENNADGDLNSYESFRLAGALEMHGSISGETSSLKEAILFYKGIAEAPGASPRGSSDAYRHIGDSYRHMSDWKSAIDAYERAVQIYPAPIYDVFRGECLMRMDRIADALTMLSRVDVGTLQQEELLDYAFIKAELAIKLDEVALMEESRKQLSEVRRIDPYFAKRRDLLLQQLSEAQLRHVPDP